MQNLIAFLEGMFGDSWPTKVLGLLLILLSLPVAGLGAGLVAWGHSEVGAIVLGQVAIMVTTGVGFMIARANSASKKAVKKIEEEIHSTQMTGAIDHADNVSRLSTIEQKVETVKQEAVKVAAVVAEQKVTEELRKGP